MLQEIFIVILKMSIISSVAVILIICLRFLLSNKLPRIFSYAIWGIVLIRLLIPFSFSSSFSIFNIISASQKPITDNLFESNKEIETKYNLDNENIIKSDTQIIESNNLKNDVSSEVAVQSQPNQTNEVTHYNITYVWLTGFLGLLGASIYIYIRSLNSLKTSVIYKDNGLVEDCSKRLNFNQKVKIFMSEHISTPVVCGLFKPRIILPLNLDKVLTEKDLKHIITHELIHIKRFDYIIKLLSVFALCMHWFNPFIWVGFMLAQKDMEMSCDEKVLSVYRNDIRSEYALSLISIAEKQKMFLNGGLLAFGESSIKSRIKGIMKYKKTGTVLGTAAVITLIVFSLVMLTNGKDTGFKKEDIENANTDKALKYNSFSNKIESKQDLQDENEEKLDKAISAAIKKQGEGYGKGECVTEGHIKLIKEEKNDIVKVYTISSVGWFGFEKGIFTKVSGSGAIPTVMTFSNNSDGEYVLEEYKEPLDGADNLESIKKMFPQHLHDRVLSAHKDYQELKRQQEEQALQYLRSIGKEAVVSADHVEKRLVDINVEASNLLFSGLTKYDEFLNNCPYWIGSREKIEDGIRFIYETSQSKSDDGYDLVTFRKTKEDGTVVEERMYKIIGNEPKLVSKLVL